MFSGKARVGKSTSAKILKDKLDNAIILSFASKLKEDINILIKKDVEKIKIRSILQVYGQTMKDIYGQDYWTKKIVEKINQDKEHQYFIIDDWRFEYEFDDLKKHLPNFKFIKIKIIDKEGKIENKNTDNHISENHLNNYKGFDFELKKEKDLQQMKKKIYNIIRIAIV